MKELIILGFLQTISLTGYFLNKGSVNEGFKNLTIICAIALLLYFILN